MQPVLADATIEDDADPAGTPPAFERRPSPWPAVLALVAAAVSGAVLWGSRSRFSDPESWAGIAAGAAAAPVLLSLIWLLTLRTSRAEARRFASAGAAMRAEAAALERTVGRLSVALEANRALLGEQLTTLTATGDVAEDRLAGVARSIADQATVADERARSVAQMAETAQAGVAALLAALPRAQAGVEDAGAALEAAGRRAGEQAAALEDRFAALAERAGEADALADGAGRALEVQSDRIDQASRAATARLDAASAGAARAVDSLFERTDRKLDEAERRLGERGSEVTAMVDRSQQAVERAALGSAERLASRVAEVEEAVERVAGRLEAQRASGDLIVDALRGGIADVDERLEALHVRGSERAQLLAASISALSGSADAMTESLRAGDAMASRTITTTETLLIALDSAAREIDETLPQALMRLDERVAGSRRVVGEVKPDLLALVTAAEGTHDAVEAIAGVIADQRRLLDALLGMLVGGRTQAAGLGQAVGEAAAQALAFADDVAPRARAALAAVLPEAVASLETASNDAMRRAAAESVERQVRSVAAAAKVAEDAAARAGQRVAGEVEALLASARTVDERIATARSEREDAEGQALSRRSAQLIDALHSAAIDVTRALSVEVADSVWAAYLKGDRGVFTRRAVRLLDDGQGERVSTLYAADAGFRDGVNRYVHDFEAMLRQVLDRPEGSALAITLVSSDMGKLYVALAQGIERLR